MTYLTHSRLVEVLRYDANSGQFTWLPRSIAEFPDLRSGSAWNARYAGKVAGGMSNCYISIRIDGKAYWAHRLAFLFMIGKWPSLPIDHINGNPIDNRFDNLREATQQMNCENRREAPAKRSDLPMGVYFNARKVTRRFSASIRIGGRSTHLGYFDSADEAHQKYLDFKREHHAGCTI